MKTREKKSLALTLIGHGVVLMAVFLSAAFIHRPMEDVMMLDFGIGGPKSPGGAPPPPASRDEEPPRPKPPSQPAEPKPSPPPKPAEDQSDFALRKKHREKKPVPEKIKPKPAPEKKPNPKRTPPKPAVQKSNRMVVRNQAAKPALKPAPKGESASDIRRRLEEKLGRSNPSSDSTAGPAGDGTGNASGTSNRFAAYLGALEEQIQVAWEQPPSAAAGMITEVGFFLEKSGHLTGIRITKPSANTEMDQSALLAVKSIGMYQPWPEDFTSDLARITVEFECKPNP